MSAARFTLTTTPVKVSDGTKPTYIQEIIGVGARFTCTPSAPTPGTDPHCVIKRGEISLPAGFPIWAWTSDRDSGFIQVTVLAAEF
ncbi:MAG: hypothetical protein RR182_01160 [Alistipes sp.]